jgi:diketogulonate reductase-like aldo/keto reductase
VFAQERVMEKGIHRREWLGRAVALAGAAGSGAALAQPAPELLRKPVGRSAVTLPVIGLGSWITFNVGDDAQARASCTEVMRQFFLAGGRMIDSSPMYGSSQPVIGAGLARLQAQAQVFSAEKVWTSGSGTAQVEASRRHWGVAQFDLLQVHNLLAWETQLPLLFEMKRAGQLRFVGITTSHGRRHGEVEQLMRTQPLDFVQISYSIVDREVEQRILPLARERGIAVIANRPFREGALIRAVQREPLPAWAAEAGCANWPEFLLKFVVSHPAVTCAIPATSRVDHLRENMGAARGRMPDAAQRTRMAAAVAAL